METTSLKHEYAATEWKLPITLHFILLIHWISEYMCENFSFKI